MISITTAEAAGKYGEEAPKSFKDWSLAAHPRKRKLSDAGPEFSSGVPPAMHS